MTRRAVVTGAFSYTGAAVAAELARRGWQIHTLTNRRAPAGSGVTASPLRFAPEHLRRELAGADVLVNTFWIRLPLAAHTFATAVARSGVLLDAAVTAGVRRVVHVSVSNAAAGRDLGYYRGKDEVEALVRALPVGHAIVRPTLVVGPGDVLTNNIAWLLRHFPFFPVPASQARVQPVTLDDAARIIADAAETDEPVEVDAAGPEVFAFGDYVRRIARACRVHRLVFPAPDWLALAGLKILSPLLRDIVLTREELRGLRLELLLSRSPPRGAQSVAGWLDENGAALGRRYVNDERRHFGAGAAAVVLDPGQPTWRRAG